MTKPTKDQLNRVIAEKVLGWEITEIRGKSVWKNQKIYSRIGSNKTLRENEEDFFTAEGLMMVLDSCQEKEMMIIISLVPRNYKVRIFEDKPEWGYGYAVAEHLDSALYTALYQAFGGEA